jgi:hypothetical protein
MKYILLYLFVLLPILLWGQTLSKTQTTAVPINTSTATGIQVQEPNLASLRKELEGTFSVEITQPNYQILYTENLLEAIKTNREATSVFRLTWDAYTTIVIFPLSQISTSISNTPKSE